LAEHAGAPVTRDQLFEELRGIPYDGLDRSMDMRVSQLRKRLVEAHPDGLDPIRTVRGVGYQLVSG
ncbi:MAG: helix-turn-helix domain-containing protein, partial [Myxococcota bacterium]